MYLLTYLLGPYYHLQAPSPFSIPQQRADIRFSILWRVEAQVERIIVENTVDINLL